MTSSTVGVWKPLRKENSTRFSSLNIIACGQNKRYPTGYKIACTTFPNKGLLCQENAFLFDGESDFCVWNKKI